MDPASRQRSKPLGREPHETDRHGSLKCWARRLFVGYLPTLNDRIRSRPRRCPQGNREEAWLCSDPRHLPSLAFDLVVASAALSCWYRSMAEREPLKELRSVELVTPEPPEPRLRSAPLAIRQPSHEGRLALFSILTPREKTVLAELMEGDTAEAIARRSRVTVSTTHSQIRSILQKLGINSPLAAAAFAHHARWRYCVDDESGNPPSGEANDNGTPVRSIGV
jgi:DNA-binding CsgD family transcriptional regulator